MEKYGRARQATDDDTSRRMCTVCWMTEITDTHSKYVIIFDFALQQWLRERASMLRYTHVQYLSCSLLVLSVCLGLLGKGLF